MLLEDHPDDFLRFEPDDLTHWQEEADGSARDLWNTQWMYSSDGVGRNFHGPALADWNDLDTYLATIPDPQRAERFAACREDLATADERYRLGVFWLAFFERLHMIRGMDRLFLDFYEYPDRVSVLMDAVQQYLLTTIEQFGRLGMDGILLGEDWGMQDRLMISPAMWREWFKPHYKTIFDAIHSLGMDVWMHSCGRVDDIIADLIEVGLDVLHPLQYGCVDWETISHRFRGSVCFCGSVDVTHILVNGSGRDIVDHVQQIVDLFGSSNGGLILAPANTIMPETPLENIKTLLETIEKYR